VVFAGRRQPILIVVVVLDGLVMLGLAGFIGWKVVEHQLPKFFLFAVPFALLSFVGAAFTILTLSYEIAGADLIVRQGQMRRTVPIATIEDVLPAVGRLQVHFVAGTAGPALFLDPQDRAAFLQGLAQADPGLTYDGERLTRG
jgi:hypothetical protein